MSEKDEIKHTKERSLKNVTKKVVESPRRKEKKNTKANSVVIVSKAKWIKSQGTLYIDCWSNIIQNFFNSIHNRWINSYMIKKKNQCWMPLWSFVTILSALLDKKLAFSLYSIFFASFDIHGSIMLRSSYILVFKAN